MKFSVAFRFHTNVDDCMTDASSEKNFCFTTRNLQAC